MREARIGRDVARKLTCNAEITENDVAVCIDKDVLGFKVSVYDVMCVDVLNGKELNNIFRLRKTNDKKRDTYEFCHVEPNRFLVKFFQSLQALEITSREVLLSMS